MQIVYSIGRSGRLPLLKIFYIVAFDFLTNQKPYIIDCFRDIDEAEAAGLKIALEQMDAIGAQLPEGWFKMHEIN